LRSERTEALKANSKIENYPIGVSRLSPPKETEIYSAERRHRRADISPRPREDYGGPDQTCPWSLSGGWWVLVVVGASGWWSLSHPIIIAIYFTQPGLVVCGVIIPFPCPLISRHSLKHGHTDLQKLLRSTIMTTVPAVNGLDTTQPLANGNKTPTARPINVLKFGGQCLVAAKRAFTNCA
jgi:hypothetical protein